MTEQMQQFGVKQEQVFIIDYDDFNALISDQYNVSGYEYVTDIEGSNDTSEKYNVYNKPLSDYDLKEVDKFRETGEYNYLASTLLRDMCARGIILPGTYYIDICW